MPITRELTSDELQGLENQGIDSSAYKGKQVTLATDDEVAQQGQPAQATKEPIGKLSTIARQAKAHIGGYLGGGTGIAATSWLLGPEVGLPTTLIVGGLAAAGSSYGGQKLQNAVQGDELTQRLQQEAQEGEEANPNTALATDVVGSALAGGAKPNLSNIPKALLGNKEAIGKLAIGSVINPAINTGIDLATTGQLPTKRELIGQVAGGALFSEPSALGKLVHRGVKPAAEETPITEDPEATKQIDPTDKGESTEEQKGDWGATSPGEERQKQEWAKRNEKPSDYQDLADSLELERHLGDIEKAKQTADAARKQKLDEYAKMQAEKTSQDVSNTEKPLTENQGRIVNPKTLLPNNLDRGENFDRNLYAPSSDRQSYEELRTKFLDMVAKGQTQTDEFKDTWKQIEDIKNKNGGMPPTTSEEVNAPSDNSSTTDKTAEALENHIRTGTATAGSVLQHLSGMDNEFAPLAKHMLENASPEKLGDRVKFSGSPDDAYYNIPAKTTRIGSNRMTPDILIHEIGHSLITHNIPPDFQSLHGESLKAGMDSYLADPKGDVNVKELINTYNEAVKQLGLGHILYKHENSSIKGLAGSPQELFDTTGKRWLYGMGNLHEFTTMAMSDRDFQMKLNSLESGKTNGKSLWTRLVDSIRGVLGIPVKDRSLLERALKVNEALIKQPRDSSIKNEENLHAPAKTGTKPDDETRHMGWLGNTTRSTIDKIRDINHPAATVLADSFHKALNTAQELNGKWTNKVVEAGKKLSQSDKEIFQKVADYENETGKKAPSSMLRNERVRDFYNIERKVYDESGKHQLAINEPVMRNGNPTQLVQKPYAHPTTLRPEVDEVIKKNTDAPAIGKLGQDFIANQMKYGKTQVEAETAWNDFKSNLQGNAFNTAANLQHYNAVRREQGVPLPKSFTRTDPVENLQYYYQRRATDNAFYEHVESNPKALSSLGQTKDAWNKPVPKSSDGSLANNPTVQAQLKEFQGERGTPGAHNENAASSLATTLLISQPGLEVHRVGSNLITALTGYVDNPVQMGRVLGSMVKNFTSGLKTAKENGVIKFNAKSFSDVFKETSTAADKLQSLAQGVRNISSIGGLTDKMSAGLMQAGLEAAVPMKLERANAGDENAQQLMRRIDPDYKVGQTYTDAEIGKLASRLAGYIHGTGDGRTMPAWMMSDTEFSGFFKLAHWSVSQTNRFMTDVWTPATKGNYTPLVTSMFGAVLGGYVIKQIREELQGKKGQIPSISEIANSEKGLSGNKPLLAYNAIAAAQYAGFAGLLSQVAKYPFDIIYKNSPQGATFPLDEAVTDITKTAMQVGTAIANDPKIDWVELTSHVFGHLLSANIGLARVGLNQAINNGLVDGTVAEKKALSDKLGQLRRFKMVSGLPYDEADTSSNPYTNLEQKKFKMSQDPEEFSKMLPGLVKHIIDKYGDNPDVMLGKLKGLKENQYETFPSLESTPLSFVKYLTFLKKEEGDKQAQDALQDYLRHKVINEAKASVVP